MDKIKNFKEKFEKEKSEKIQNNQQDDDED